MASTTSILTDPNYYPEPGAGDISYSGDPSINPPQSDANLNYAQEFNDLTGNTVGCLNGSGPLQPGQSYCSTPVSGSSPDTGFWGTIGGVLGGLLQGIGPISFGASTAPKPATPAPTSASSMPSSSLMWILIAALVFIVLFATMKR